MADKNQLWSMPETEQTKTAMWRFAQSTAPQHGGTPDDYAALHGWSVAEPEAFYAALWDELDIIGKRGTTVFNGAEDQREVRFFPDARLNYAENLLRDPDDTIAVVAHRDDGTRRTITRAALRDQVSRLEQALRDAGVIQGDRVAAIVTHDIEAIVGYLATAAIGAIWSSCSPDFGPAGAADRLCQVDPKVLIALPEYGYAGKRFDIAATIRAVAQNCGLQQIILIGEHVPDALLDLPAVTWREFVTPYSPAEIPFVRMGFDAPLAILFSSGTTGKPKCIVHSAAGLLLQHLKEQKLHCDIGPNDQFFYFTTCGWMMWNWQVSGLALGATLITYDGNPFYPAPERLIDLIDAEKITVFGTSAKYVDACLKAEVKPQQTHDLESLRLILSTGSPLIPASFDYVYRDWKDDIHLASISGGTDICACFLGGTPLLPVIRGELQCAMLGLDVDSVDEDGLPVSGEAGELICRNAHLSMPLSFWGDADGSRYRDAYFARFPGTWAHGDFVERRPSGGWVIHGRSDTTLNPGGVRIGTAEIYRQVETIDSVEEALAIGQDWDGDQRVVLFVKMKAGIPLTDALRTDIRQRIRKGATPRHMPAKIIAVEAIPRTRSGKISEIAVRDIVHGRTVKNTTALANPESLDLYDNLAELQE